MTLQGADVGDTTTILETAIAAAEQVEDAQANVDDRQSLEEIVGDKGYHSNQTLIDLDAVGIRSYVSEPDRGRRDWSKDPEARAPVYGNRRRMRGRRGRRLMRQRGERIERSFAHLYDTGGMRRTHLRGHTNILKRLLIHAGGFNLVVASTHPGRARSARVTGHVCRQLVSGDHLHHGLLTSVTVVNLDLTVPRNPLDRGGARGNQRERERLRQHLQRHVPVELGVSGAIHFAHPAFADLGGDGIRAEGGAGLQ